MSTLLALPPRRGTPLLLAHCAEVARTDRRPAADRLRSELGGELARRLVRALVRDQGVGPSSRLGRVSFTP